MNVMVILIIISFTVAVGFLIAFVWAVRSGQFDDAATPSYRILWDDATTKKKENHNQSSNHKQQTNGN